MKFEQLSIFMENRVGVINEVTSILAKAGVNMQAFSVAEGNEFGILRLIVADVERTKEVVSSAGFSVCSTDVLCIRVPNVAGGLSEVLECLAQEDIFISYMYAFSQGDVALTVIRPTDIERAIEVLGRSRAELLSKSELYSF